MNRNTALKIIIPIVSAAAVAQSWPEIKALRSGDIIYSQYQDDIQFSNREFMAHGKPEVNFYCYVIKKNDEFRDFLTLCGRCGVKQDSIASLNSIQNAGPLEEGTRVILPTANGVYIREKPSTSMDILLSAQFREKIERENLKPMLTIDGERFYFLPGESYSPTLRGYFLNPGMELPLARSVLTSPFGMRMSPITGGWKFHKGIDMAAPIGTSVLASKGGTVRSVIMGDAVYGNYIVIDHMGKTQTLYAHLGDVMVEQGQKVSTGQRIAKVGLTGQTTGPHLHFEIRQNGSAINPSQKLKKAP